MSEAITNLSAIKENFRNLRERAGCEVIAVVKANAYGHGAVSVSRALLDTGTKMLAVATVEEAVELRQAGIRAPILLLCALLSEEIPAIFENQIIPTITEIEVARRLSSEAESRGRKIVVHIKIDTGLGRIGFLGGRDVEIEDTAVAIREIMRLPGLSIEGIYTHFALTSGRDKSFSYGQIAGFKEVLRHLPSGGASIPFRHIASSGSILGIAESYKPPFNLIRPGLGLYGLYYQGAEQTVPLTPALRLTSPIVFLKMLPPGRSVSYGRLYTTSRPTKVATVAIGYADGYNRGLTNKAKVEVRRKFSPVIGSVCMDQIMVDVSDVPDVEVGNEVVVYSDERDAPNSIENIARLLNTVPNEVLCAIGRRVKRIYRS